MVILIDEHFFGSRPALPDRNDCGREPSESLLDNA
jgi:hypothetical protein